MGIKRIEIMLGGGKIPFEHGVWIDCYNYSVNNKYAGTLTTRVDSCNHYYVTIIDEKDNSDKHGRK